MSYQIDQAGVELIASFEGYVDGVYNDSRSLATVGYGHLLHYSPATPADHHAYDGRGRAFFENLLCEDIQRVAIGPMNRALRPGILNQNQVNAVASGCFNCGAGFVEGTVGREINAGHLNAAADDFMLWDHPSVLEPRRRTERALFLTPVQHSDPLPWLTTAERRWCLEYDHLKARNADPHRRAVLRRVMRGQATRIASAAHHEGGWNIAHRRQRYHSLVARST